VFELRRYQARVWLQVKHLGDRQNPDLFFNQGTVLKYLEQYAASLHAFQRAGLEDATLPYEEEMNAIVRFVSRMAEGIESRVGLKLKKFHAEIEKLQKAITGDPGKAATPLTALKEGPNENAVLLCKIMACYAIGSDPVPVSFIVSDQAGTLMALSIYHVNAEVYSIMKVFGIVMISNPVLRCIQVEWQSKVYSYNYICIENPSDVVIGGKRLVAREAKLVVSRKGNFSSGQ